MGAGASIEVSDENKVLIEATKALLGDKAKCAEIWAKVDINGNGLVSVAEMDKMIGESSAEWDGFFAPVVDEGTGKPKQPVLIRAWKKATGREYSTHEDGFIHKHEFKPFVRLIMMYNYLFTVFDELNGDDRRISEEEFVAGVGKLGAGEEGTDLSQTFKNIDTNGGGQILFDEFCHYAMCLLDAQ